MCAGCRENWAGTVLPEVKAMSSFTEIVDRIHELDMESKEELLHLLRGWLIEERRLEIRINADDAFNEHRRGLAHSGGLTDMMADLDGDD
jgi:hypothetical protein